MTTAYELAIWLQDEYAYRPVFSVKIGLCSPQLKNVDLETAIEEYTRCVEDGKFTMQYLEYAFIYVPE